jgi:hypothetical protein
VQVLDQEQDAGSGVGASDAEVVEVSGAVARSEVLGGRDRGSNAASPSARSGPAARRSRSGRSPRPPRSVTGYSGSPEKRK